MRNEFFEKLSKLILALPVVFLLISSELVYAYEFGFEPGFSDYGFESIGFEPGYSDYALESVGFEPGYSDYSFEPIDFTPGSSDFSFDEVTFTPGSSDFSFETIEFTPGTSDFDFDAISFAPGTSDIDFESIDFTPGTSEVSFESISFTPGVSEIDLMPIGFVPGVSGFIFDTIGFIPGISDIFLPGVTFQPGSSNVSVPGLTFIPGTSNIVVPGLTFTPGSSNIIIPGVTFSPGSSQIFLGFIGFTPGASFISTPAIAPFLGPSVVLAQVPPTGLADDPRVITFFGSVLGLGALLTYALKSLKKYKLLQAGSALALYNVENLLEKIIYQANLLVLALPYGDKFREELLRQTKEIKLLTADKDNHRMINQEIDNLMALLQGMVSGGLVSKENIAELNAHISEFKFRLKIDEIEKSPELEPVAA